MIVLNQFFLKKNSWDYFKNEHDNSGQACVSYPDWKD